MANKALYKDLYSAEKILILKLFKQGRTPSLMLNHLASSKNSWNYTNISKWLNEALRTIGNEHGIEIPRRTPIDRKVALFEHVDFEPYYELITKGHLWPGISERSFYDKLCVSSGC